VQLLLAIYALMLARHSLNLQHTLVRAIQLESESRRLAKQFQGRRNGRFMPARRNRASWRPPVTTCASLFMPW
jgi:hypothetical protein